MLDVRLFRNRRFSAASGAIALAFFALFGTIFFLTQYLQSVLGYSAFESGLRVMPVAAGLILGGPLSAKLSERIGTKRVVGAGLAFVSIGLTMLSGAEVDSGYGLVAAVLLVLGLGMGLIMAPATESVMGSLPLAKAERRLGGQRRHADDGRRAGRRGARVAPVQRLPCRHGRRYPGTPERGGGDGEPVARRRARRGPADRRRDRRPRLGRRAAGVRRRHADRSARRRRDRRARRR